MTTVDLAQTMKDGMRRLASGVCILSACDQQGERYAMTVSSVTSVSDSPASLLVCVNESASMCGLLQLGAGFVVNVLSAQQADVSNLCAGQDQGAVRFSLGDWQLSEQGLPYLADAQAAFFCRHDQDSQYGTHKIVIGSIERVSLSDAEVDPLIYLDGGYKSV